MSPASLAGRAPAAAGRDRLDAARLREDFPIFRQRPHGRELVYLDSAATSQKPRAVIDAISRFYETENSNVHRGVHWLSERATESYEKAREAVRAFLGAASAREIVFVRGTTEGINLVAGSFGRRAVEPGDEILLTAMEHHSNIVPWQMLCEEKEAVLRVAPIDDRGDVILEEYERLLGPRTKIVGIVHVSNALGTVNPVRQMIEMARRAGAAVVLDGAQSAPHLPVDVRELDCDFFALSGHKLYGPTGIGVLYGKERHLEAMPPYQGGGDMIRSVTFEKTTYNSLPHKFEAGTPHISGAVGLSEAIAYVAAAGRERIAEHEHELLAYAVESLRGVAGLEFIGTARQRAGVVSFVLDGIHPHDVGTILDREGIAIRTGHHCAQPVMQRFGVAATARASFGLYNTRDDVDRLVAGLSRVREVFA
jgi:cysteine desulfurase/selenocysteine lyase